MPNSSRMLWPYPGADADPWYVKFAALVAAQDASAYAAREDRMLVLGGSATWSLASDGTLSWDAALDIFCPLTGLKNTLPGGSKAIADGEAMYVTLTRAPQTTVSLTAITGAVPSTDNNYVICVRSGDVVYFRNGVALTLGSSTSLLMQTSNPFLVWAGGRESCNSDTVPVVAGGFAFSPADYNLNGLSFRAVAKNGNTGLTNYVRLWNVTDDEQVAELVFTSTSLAKDEATLVLGSGTGEVDSTEHLYEVRIVLGSAPGGGSDTIELYSAELRAT